METKKKNVDHRLKGRSGKTNPKLNLLARIQFILHRFYFSNYFSNNLIGRAVALLLI